jgi:hypothetical protein
MVARVKVPEALEGVTIPDADLRFCQLPVVYVAGPYTTPDALTASGLALAFVPHVTFLQHLVTPHDVDHWYALDYAFLAKCDALLRIPGDSTGADKEARLAYELEIPVFYDPDKVLEWAADW